jgi:hypothetical protein
LRVRSGVCLRSSTSWYTYNINMQREAACICLLEKKERKIQDRPGQPNVQHRLALGAPRSISEQIRK